jgi:hypothetical protein
MQNYDSILKFGSYIYNDFENDNIGLKRKYNKFLSIKQMCHFDEYGNINTNRKLTIDQIKEIRKLYKTKIYPSRLLGKIFNVDKSIILDIINMKLHKDII